MPHVGDIASLDVPDRMRREGPAYTALVLNKKYYVDFSENVHISPSKWIDPVLGDWVDVPEGLYLSIPDERHNRAKLCVMTNYERVRKQILLNLDDGAEVLVYGIVRWVKIRNGEYGILCKRAFVSYTEFKRFEDLTCDALKTYELLTGDYDPEGLPF
jgi:hypothetical protein